MSIKPVKNIFILLQVKKMICKRLIIQWDGLNVPPHEIKMKTNNIKTMMLKSSSKKGIKKLIMTAVCINGILNIIGSLESLMAIVSLSYKEIQKTGISDMKIVIIQYPKLSRRDIKKLIGYGCK